MHPPPLGRSLTPLPGESLPGFLLRLSHRLRIAPARLAVLTGLVDRNAPRTDRARIVARHMLALSPEIADSFAHATRLTSDEVAQLCLSRYADRYPALKHSDGNNLVLAHFARRGWTLISSTRYCQQCLAGDTSSVQQRHGGAWQQAWRLRVVFACTTRRTLLHHQCHQCLSLAGSSQQGAGVRLIPHPSYTGLHPAQCRSPTGENRSLARPPACGARLDDLTIASTSADASMLDLQHRILQRLEPGGPVPAAEAAQYFDLLLLVHTLVMFTWPLARELTKLDTQAEATDRHVDQIRREIADLNTAKIMRSGVNMPRKRLPIAPDATAEFLLIADRLLGWDDLDNLTARIRPLAIEAARVNREAWHWLRRHDAWPTAVRQTLGHQIQGFAVPAIKSAKHCPAPHRQCRFTAQHIPQRLPDAWSRHYLPAPDGIAHTHLRRAMALKLIEMASGQPWTYGANELGLPRGHAANAVQQARHWMRNEANQAHMTHAAEELAKILDETATPVNYALRRQAMQHWLMPDIDWDDFAAVVRGQTQTGRGRPYKLNDRTRQTLIVRIWTAVTSGEHLFAPLVIADRHAHPGLPWNAGLARAAGETLYTTHRGPDNYTRIRTITNSYATELAAHIDITESANHFSWDPSSLSLSDLSHRGDYSKC